MEFSSSSRTTPAKRRPHSAAEPICHRPTIRFSSEAGREWELHMSYPHQKPQSPETRVCFFTIRISVICFFRTPRVSTITCCVLLLHGRLRLAPLTGHGTIGVLCHYCYSRVASRLSRCRSVTPLISFHTSGALPCTRFAPTRCSLGIKCRYDAKDQTPRDLQRLTSTL